jgi:hypothetical protein
MRSYKCNIDTIMEGPETIPCNGKSMCKANNIIMKIRDWKYRNMSQLVFLSGPMLDLMTS